MVLLHRPHTRGRALALRLTAVAAAVLAACGPALAADDEAKPQVESTVTLGGAVADGSRADRALFGQYSDWRDHRGAVYLGLDYWRRNPEEGTSVLFEATNLFSANREATLRWQKHGDWAVRASLNGSVRNDPLELSNAPTLRIERTALGIGLSKVLSDRWQVDVSLSSEKREGNRLFGVGMTCPSTVAPTCGTTTAIAVGYGVLLLPEPVDSNHTQIEARATYAGDPLRFSIGYLGSFFRNSLELLTPTVPATLLNAVGTSLAPSAGLAGILGQPVALAPDNQAHQFDLTGVYRVAPTARLQFKLAHTTATQRQGFAAVLSPPAGTTDLGGRVDTTLGQLALNWRPMPRLTVDAKLRHEERNDSTPLALYSTEGTATYTNHQLPQRRDRAQLQAGWRFDADYSGTLAVEQEAIDRGAFTSSSAVGGITALRQKTDETTVRAELRKRLGEDVSGAVIAKSQRRGGSTWLRDNSGLGVTPAADNDPAFVNGIFMPTLANRRRDTLSLLANWQPSDSLSLQVSATTGRDRYDTPSAYGLRNSGTDQLSLDGSYALNEKWSATATLSYGRETLRQGKAAATFIDYRNTSSSAGVGLVGKPTSTLEIGGNVSYHDDRSVYQQTLEPSADPTSVALLAATGGLPDIVFRQGVFRAYARYQLDKTSELRADLIHQRTLWTDWAWAYNGVSFTDSAGNSVLLQPKQAVTVLALRYSLRWR